MPKEIGRPMTANASVAISLQNRGIGRAVGVPRNVPSVPPIHEYFAELERAENAPPKPITIGNPLRADTTRDGFSQNNGKYGQVIYPDDLQTKDRAYINLRNATTRALNRGDYVREGIRIKEQAENMLESLTQNAQIARRR